MGPSVFVLLQGFYDPAVIPELRKIGMVDINATTKIVMRFYLEILA